MCVKQINQLFTAARPDTHRTPIPVPPYRDTRFLKPIGLGQYRLAKEIDVPAQRISKIVLGKRSITADTDLRLCRFFGLSNRYWLRAQVAYDTEVAERSLNNLIMRIKSWYGHIVQHH